MNNAITVTFIEPSGDKRQVQALPGQNLMDAALSAGVAGITGQCGGAINCATCLCDLVPDQTGTVRPQPLDAAHADEVELLSYVDEASTKSRLTCQLLATPALDGLILRVVETTN